MEFARPQRAPDYSDRFAGPNASPEMSARELMGRAFEATPGWFRALFALRQTAARIAGLSTGPKGAVTEVEVLGRLPVVEETDDKFEFGMADSHLDFTIAVEKGDADVAITTDIWFNGWTGRAYLTLVLPFHKMILRRYVAALGPGGGR
ncbi:MAG: DUF2867 domain-containing protein [Pseudomonadota bacterium]